MQNNSMLENSSTKKLFFKFAVPSILGMLIVSFQIMIDGMFLGYYVGPNALASVNLAMPVFNLIFSITLMICIGGAVLTGIAQGNKNESRALGLTTYTLILLFSTLTILAVILLLNLDPLLNFLGANATVYNYIKPYLGVSIALSPFFNLVIFSETFVRLNGKPNLVFLSGILCCLGNVFLDYLFVAVLNYGMIGAAVASCVANFVGFLALIFHVKFGKIVATLKDTKDIFYNGSSELLTTISTGVATYIFNITLMKSIGVLGVSALTIVFYISSIVNVSLYGLSQALIPIISYNLGAKKFIKIKEVLNLSLFTGVGIGAITFILIQIFNEFIIRVFSKGDESLVLMTKQATFFVSFSYLLSFYNIIASTFHTSIEKPIESVVISLCRSLILVAILLFVLPKFFGITGFWLVPVTAEILCLIISVPLTIKSMKNLKLSLT